MATIPVGITIFNFPSVSQGQRGDLTFVEGNTNVPFSIERVFWIYGVSTSPHIERGGHAHKECEQVLIAVKGTVFIEMNRLTYQLRHPAQGVYVPPGVLFILTIWNWDRAGNIYILSLRSS